MDAVIVVCGELDACTVSALDKAITDCDAATVAVDVAAISFIDSSGLNLLAIHRNRLHAEGRALELRNVPSNMGRVIELAGLTELLNVRTGGLD